MGVSHLAETNPGLAMTASVHSELFDDHGTGAEPSDFSLTAAVKLDSVDLSFDMRMKSPVVDIVVSRDEKRAVQLTSMALSADTLVGTDGDDEFHVDDATDVVVEAANGGWDTIYTTVSYTLPDNVEALWLDAAGLRGTGNALANLLHGSSGSDTLDGGAGADTMYGGTGSDTYFVDDAGDYGGEAGSSGFDTIYTSVSYTLGQSEIEKVVLTGTGNLNLTGNSYANRLVGNAGNNILSGESGDTLEGGAGDDTYNNLSFQSITKMIEKEDGGTDTVIVRGGDFELPDNFENLVLGGADWGDLGKGNASANTITAQDGNDTLDGAAGADTLIGNGGNDLYLVDDLGDSVIELAGDGIDSVQSSIDWTLSDNVENLTLIESSSAINATGNAQDNVLKGNANDNHLFGGGGSDTLYGAEGEDVLDGGTGADEMYGSAGSILMVDNVNDKVGGLGSVISSVSFRLWYSNCTNLTLTGTTAIEGFGNEFTNHIIGNSADNILSDGGRTTTDLEADTLEGGTGNDTYLVGNVFDFGSTKVIEAANAGIDKVVSYGNTFTLPDNVENLDIAIGWYGGTGIGNELDNVITVTGADSRSDRLDGGLGADTMSGGTGDDTFVVDNLGDKTIEIAGQGVDTVESTITLKLQAEVENLTLIGTRAIDGTGNLQANQITGNAAANVLTGGAGVDTMTGGGGNDTYVVDGSSEKTIELAGGGTDQVQSSANFTLQDNVENLTLTGWAVFGTGNGLANVITGNAVDNMLNGGAGADTLIGGAGNDTYVVDNSQDKTVEVDGEGVDTVKASVAHTLQDNVENLTLIGTAVFGTGNGLANVLTGNASDNRLDGGAGIDTLIGGAGNDTFVVDNTQDKTTEVAGGGIDSVVSSVAHTLQDNVENLTLTGTAVFGTGNALANVLTGNASANTLNGGIGNDTLTGGAGADIFALTSSLGSDLITDFASGVDKLRLSQAALRVGDGDTAVENAISVAGPNGFNTSAELVVVSHDIAGALTTTSAAAAIGHANSNYAVGDTRLFVVDNGSDTAVYLFKSADVNSTVSATELTLLATLDNTASTTLSDYFFGG